MADAYDIVIIGAGAAGVAAGRALAQAQRTFLIIEARDRIGGRAHTVEREGMALDLGCGWLHAASRNVWRAEAARAGFEIDKSPPPWGRRLRRSSIESTAFARFNERVTRAETAPDRPASAYLEPDNPANEMINAVCTYLNGVTLDQVSAHDYVRYDGDGGNERAKIGYGALISALAQDLPVALHTRAAMVDHGGARVRVETDRGAIEARAVIVCTPTPIIAGEALRFSPALPAALEAAGGLPLGTVDKTFFGFHDADVPPEEEWPSRQLSLMHPTYDVRPMGRPVIEAFIAGPLAAELEREGARDSAAFLIDDLAQMLGGHIRARLRVLAASDWGRDPLSRGSYSYARPGFAEARTALAQPMAERIFFAGEACAPAFFGTAHGAAETGIAAARLALAYLARPGAT